MSLAERVAALSRFISPVTYLSTPFFDVLNKRFESIDKCEQAFQALKEHLARPLLLSKPIDRESSICTLLYPKKQSALPWSERKKEYNGSFII